MAFRPDDVIAELEGISIRTSQGTFVRMDDVRRLMEKHSTDEEEVLDDPPTNIHEARAQAKKFLESENGPGAINPGRAVPATEVQPSSRT